MKYSANLSILLLVAIVLFSIVYSKKSSASPSIITPGAVWYDTDHNVVQAHAPGIIQVGRTWYWFGEDKTDGSPFQNIHCYSSTDLAHWTFRGSSLSRQESGDLGPGRIVERPKVIYNSKTRMYVMYVHIDNSQYGEAKVGVADSRSPAGPYAYLGSFSPLGHQSRDMTLFEDDDGKGYLIFEDRARGVCIAALSDDYLTVEHEVVLIPHAYEAPAIVKAAGIYYLLGSHLTGWATNPNAYTTATSLAGPWSEYKEIAPSSPNTFNSQTAYIVTLKGKSTTSYIYLGDRWIPHNLSDSRYIWLPLQIGDGSMLLSSDQPWTVDVKSGRISYISQPDSAPRTQ
jgi:beta-xylosidase